MRTHIKVVAVVNILLSALGLLGAIGVLFSGVFGSMFSGSLTGFVVGGATSALVSIMLGAVSLFGLISGFGLLNHQQWARYVALVVACFRLFNFPIGTIFGAYTLWVLLNAETKRIFETGAMPSAAI
jgi:hypothetical protein